MTIPKNTNKAKQAIKNAHNIRCYSLSNNFSGQPLADDPVVWETPGIGQRSALKHVTQSEFLANELLHGTSTAKLSERDGRYTLHVHSNLWYEFSA